MEKIIISYDNKETLTGLNSDQLNEVFFKLFNEHNIDNKEFSKPNESTFVLTFNDTYSTNIFSDIESRLIEKKVYFTISKVKVDDEDNFYYKEKPNEVLVDNTRIQYSSFKAKLRLDLMDIVNSIQLNNNQ